MAGGVINPMAVLRTPAISLFRKYTKNKSQVVVSPIPGLPTPPPVPSPPSSGFFIRNGDPTLVKNQFANFIGWRVLPTQDENYALTIDHVDSAGVHMWWTYPSSITNVLAFPTQEGGNLRFFGLYLQRSTADSHMPNPPNVFYDVGSTFPPVPPTANGWTTIASWLNPGTGAFAPPVYTVNNLYVDSVVPTVITYYRLVLLAGFSIIV